MDSVQYPVLPVKFGGLFVAGLKKLLNSQSESWRIETPLYLYVTLIFVIKDKPWMHLDMLIYLVVLLFSYFPEWGTRLHHNAKLGAICTYCEKRILATTLFFITTKHFSVRHSALLLLSSYSFWDKTHPPLKRIQKLGRDDTSAILLGACTNTTTC